MTLRCTRAALAPAAVFALGWVASAAAQEAPQRVEIIGSSPLPGQGVDRNKLPYTTQVMRRSDIEREQPGPLTDLLSSKLSGVQVNDIQGSPYQGELVFRGFRASGLIGASQGMSVYLDGVRINEPFADVIQWDLVPEFALDSVALVPGANPAFGLNTLGGAIALTTTDGRRSPGWRSEASVASFERKRFSLSHGGDNGTWQHFVGVGLFDEKGWRDQSDGHLVTVLGKVARESDWGRLGVNVLLAGSDIKGNGLVPMFSFDSDGVRTPDLGQPQRTAVYTYPDLGRNRLAQISAHWRRALDTTTTVEALAYVRHSQRVSVNGDLSESADDDTQALLNHSKTRQDSGGASWAWASGTARHQWQVGASLDRAQVSYQQDRQGAQLDNSRGVQALDEDRVLSADVQGQSTHWGLYATGTWQLMRNTHLTTTLRFNRAGVGNTLISADEDTGVVQSHAPERFIYRNWNPALGLARQVNGQLTLFANVARNTRVPTVIELGCADPESPCRLPAGLQSDPYLAQVRSNSFEGGLRWDSGPAVSGSLTLYRTDNHNDILFSSVSTVGQRGYFRNFGLTRHQGLDAALQGRVGRWRWSGSYSHLAATYQTEGSLRVGERNLPVHPGTPIAGLPRRQFKLSVEAELKPAWSIGADLQALSRRVSAGNEDGRSDDNNATAADFHVPGYVLVNVQARWRPSGLGAPSGVKGLEAFVGLSNLFNRQYTSFGALASTRFNAQGGYTGLDQPALFAAPGAPRAVQVGLRLRL